MNTLLFVMLSIVTTQFVLMAVAAGISFISFIQIGSAAADAKKWLKTLWWILGLAFGGLAIYLLININKLAG